MDTTAFNMKLIKVCLSCECCKTMDTVLFKTRRFDNLLNRFHALNKAYHSVLPSLFVLID